MMCRDIGAFLLFTSLVLATACSSGGDTGVSAGAGSPGTAGATQAAGTGGAATSAAGNSATGGNNNSGGPGTAGSGTSGSGPIVGDGKPFVPDDVKYVLVDGGRALTLLAATLIDDGTGLYWVVAMRNDETVPLCSPQIDAAFLNATNMTSAYPGEAVVPVQGAMHQTNDLGPVPCLQPGEVGMGEQGVLPYNSGDPKTLEIDYQPRGYPTPEAVKIAGLTVESVKIVGSPTGNTVTGSVANHGSVTASAPEVYLFAQDSGGRPSDFGYDSSPADIPPGSSWSFQMTVPSPINKYTAFTVYGQQ